MYLMRMSTPQSQLKVKIASQLGGLDLEILDNNSSEKSGEIEPVLRYQQYTRPTDL